MAWTSNYIKHKNTITYPGSDIRLTISLKGSREYKVVVGTLTVAK